MGSFTGYVIIYVLGGVTFLPLIVALLFLHAYLTLKPPVRHDESSSSASCAATTGSVSNQQSGNNNTSDNNGNSIHDENNRSLARRSSLLRPNDDQFSLKSGTDVLAEKFHRAHESDVAAAGYFAVCREYVPGGVNGKPPERTTPAGEVVGTENQSPSVYQSMYRSIFERKTASASIEPGNHNNGGRNFRKARNVFYIVLRHGHLMLYDDEQQIEVRHVISLAHHDVTIYGGGEDIPEGELYAKRNAICLSRREDSIADLRGLTPPFYLFCQSQSAKEDFYHALLKTQEKIPNSPNSPPSPQLYDPKDIVKLVQDLHASEDHLQTRWINALIGRWFLAMYKTPEMYEFVQTKITKKISRVPKPNFISNIALRKIDMGQGAPSITNPRLKDLTVDGDCTVETDVSYSGNFRIEISATARIELGPRIKARSVDLVLAVVLKRLTGHMLIRFKPSPSNRVWFCFATKPDMTMSIEPVVSTRQITYGIILRGIESRIREVVEETLVYPYWDDVPFLDTASFAFRGGVWQRDIPKYQDGVEIPDESEARTESEETADAIPVDALKTKDERSWSTPDFAKSNPPSLRSSKSFKSMTVDSPIDEGATSSSVDKRSNTSPLETIRTRTFSNVAEPVVTADHGKAEKTEGDSPKAHRRNRSKRDATSSMMEIKTRSHSNSVSSTPYGSPPEGSILENAASSDSADTMFNDVLLNHERGKSQRPSSSNSDAMASNVSLTSSTTASDGNNFKGKFESNNRSFTSISSDKRSTTIAAIGTATAAAKKWGWNVLNKSDQRRQPGDASFKPGTPEHPIGRGRPLPPPGTPLPPPERNGFMSNSISMPRRKPVPPAPGQSSEEKKEDKRPVPSPPLPKRKTVPLRDTNNVIFTDEILVVEAPPDSEPNSPAVAVAPPLPPNMSTNLVSDVTLSSSKPEETAPVDIQRKTSDNHIDEDDDTPWDSGFEQISGSSEDIDTSSTASKAKTKPASSPLVEAETTAKHNTGWTPSQEDLLL
ncbi:conserved hypothetical protein [Talaromyces stipitatus ATCC 10500]|uniref:SMP-LTD domain-containing protein n=1 Tax=Talaromyces stipitatus (strain ATCC 10500 / CBS 375.48 / QM 6759 / NRRL 1006) TaxID=441959 RepID=B8MMU2_TALSN|nr:uncharacterized protein TSTA_100890 [Talaromyces stipitatus ATCC 10500]EED13848.1 conserved hypothetical protein [Talaromyces stipitatus ATCC 10500]